MKEAFTEQLGLNEANNGKLATINGIIQEFKRQGYKLTLRQLYYQLVSRDIIANKLPEYAKLSSLLVKGRMAGIVDWDAIEDRLRVPFLPYWVEGIDDAIEDTIKQYRLNRQEGQDSYIEVWVEKDALSGVLKRITSKYHVNLMVNRGYSSCTAMHDAYKRFYVNSDKKGYILYLGDHDPSGLDMIRDISDRMRGFGVTVKVIPIALTMQQIEEFNPPPNPAKITDPRANDYIAEHGNTSWEVDALDPDTLHKILRENIEKLIDMDKFNAVVKQEEEDKQRLEEIKDD